MNYIKSKKYNYLLYFIFAPVGIPVGNPPNRLKRIRKYSALPVGNMVG